MHVDEKATSCQTNLKKELGRVPALAGGSAGWGIVLCTRSQGLTPSQGTYLRCGFDPRLECMLAAMYLSFSPFLSPLSSLSKNK